MNVHKYCTHIQLQHYGGATIVKTDTLSAARDAFVDALHDARNWRDDEACSASVFHTDGEPCECDSAMNFHDYPAAMWVLGPRGGIRPERV